MTSRKQRLQMQMSVLAEELVKLSERPDEPAGDVIRFTKKFRDTDRHYSYVARRSADTQLWYVSGRVNTNHKTWDELLDFVTVDDPEALTTLEVATRWKKMVTK